MLHMGLKNPVAQTSLVQLMQGAEPRVGLKVLVALHEIQSVPSGPVYPWLQLQKVISLLFSGEKAWRGQLTQVVEALWFIAYLPASHTGDTQKKKVWAISTALIEGSKRSNNSTDGFRYLNKKHIGG
jgi:hypothetical protein